MIHLDLTADEIKTLAAILECELGDLSYEIANTDQLNYRNRLKQRRVVLAKVLGSLTETRQLV